MMFMISREYFENKIGNFDESTVLIPNANGEKENGKIIKTRFEIDKTDFSKFCKYKFISMNTLFLASVILTLNKFNSCDEILIYYDENIPFATKLENKDITIKEFLTKTNENLQETDVHKSYPVKELLNEYNLKPEFYYGFNESLKNPSEITYSNYLNIADEYKSIIISFFYNDLLYSEEYIELFLKCIEIIIQQIVNSEIDNMTIENILKAKD